MKTKTKLLLLLILVVVAVTIALIASSAKRLESTEGNLNALIHTFVL